MVERRLTRIRYIFGNFFVILDCWKNFFHSLVEILSFWWLTFFKIISVLYNRIDKNWWLIKIKGWISFANGSKSFWKNLEPRSDKIDSIIPKNGAIKNCRKIYARGGGGRKWKEFLENDLTRIRHGSTVEQCHERNQIGTKTEIAEWVERNESWRKRNWCRFSRKRGTFCRKWRPVSRGKRFKTTTVLMMTKRCTLSEANERVAALLRRIKGGHNRSVGCWKAAPNNFVPPLSPLLPLSLFEWRGQVAEGVKCKEAIATPPLASRPTFQFLDATAFQKNIVDPFINLREISLKKIGIKILFRYCPTIPCYLKTVLVWSRKYLTQIPKYYRSNFRNWWGSPILEEFPIK